MLPLWGSILLGLGIPSLLLSMFTFFRRRNREIASLTDEIQLNVRLLEALLRQIDENSFRNEHGILDYATPQHRVDFYFTRYQALLPLDHLPRGVVADVLLFYEKLERLADFCRRLGDGEDIAARVELDPPGPIPMTRRRVASWELHAVAETNRIRGEEVLVRLRKRNSLLIAKSLLERLTGNRRRRENSDEKGSTR